MEQPPRKQALAERRVGLLVLALLALGVVLLVLRAGRRSTPSEPGAASASARPSTAAVVIADRPPIVLDAARASKLMRLSLDCVDRPYPYAPGAVLESESSLAPPRRLTPSFYGCFDWHSAVHGHWAMVRVLSRFPTLPEADAIRAKLDQHLAAEPLARELAYLAETRNKGFERPYGWGWLLRLAAEVGRSPEPNAAAWGSALAPLAELLSARMSEYLPRLTAPVRAGTHSSTAFAMIHMLDYARTVGDEAFAQLLERKARDFYLGDWSCPLGYEPSGEDFISPCLVEADSMRRVLSPAELGPWLDGFLPPIDSPAFAPLLAPAEVRDRTDPRIGHLIGLGLQRAAALEGLAAGLGSADGRTEPFQRLARVHAHDALTQMFDSGYGGEHWLGSFAIYLLTDVSGDARPGKP